MSEVFEQVMAQCARGCFTGLLRIQTRAGRGEIRFLSGIQDEIRFDALEGDAALERLQAAEEPEFEAIQSLPPIEPNGTTPVPIEGGLDRFHAAQLMRYCESNSLTCALELEALGKVLTARYRLGELLSVEPDSELTAQLAEAKQGLYRFRLPRFELPASTRQTRPGTAPATAVPVTAAPAASPALAAAASAARSDPAFAVASPGRGATSSAPKAAYGSAQGAPSPGLHSRPTPVATPAAHARHSAPTPVSTPAPKISPQALTPLGQPVAAKPRAPYAAAVSSPPAKPAASAARAPAAVSGSVRPAARAAQPSQSPIASASKGTSAGSPAARAAAPAAARPAAAVRAEVAAPAAPVAHAAQPAASPASSARPAANPRRAPAPAADRAPEPVVRPVPKAAPRAPRVAEPAPSQHRYWLALAALVALALAGWVAFGAHLPGRG